MANILVLGGQTRIRTLLSESLQIEGHGVESVSDAAILWEQLANTHPDLVLLDAGADGFGTMTLFQDIKEQVPGLDVIVYQCRNYSDVDRIKRAAADALVNPWFGSSRFNLPD
jgi:DNA-binding NtrC family response regulator